MDWVQVGINLAAFVLLLVLWRVIREINRKTARGIQLEIDAVSGAHPVHRVHPDDTPVGRGE